MLNKKRFIALVAIGVSIFIMQRTIFAVVYLRDAISGSVVIVPPTKVLAGRPVLVQYSFTNNVNGSRTLADYSIYPSGTIMTSRAGFCGTGETTLSGHATCQFQAIIPAQPAGATITLKVDKRIPRTSKGFSFPPPPSKLSTL